jgi:hypothetical protein
MAIGREQHETVTWHTERTGWSIVRRDIQPAQSQAPTCILLRPRRRPLNRQRKAAISRRPRSDCKNQNPRKESLPAHERLNPHKTGDPRKPNQTRIQLPTRRDPILQLPNRQLPNQPIRNRILLPRRRERPPTGTGSSRA